MAISIPESPDTDMTSKKPSPERRTGMKALAGLLVVATVVMTGAVLRKDLPSNSLPVVAMNEDSSVGRQLQVNGPDIVWFFTYPESGTTYIMHLFHVLSGKSTASNYGSLIMDSNGKMFRPDFDSRPVFSNEPGPHYNSILPAPENFVLTRTHSYGTCFDCPPWKYLGPSAKLKHMKINSYASKRENGVVRSLKYKAGRVKKMLLMYRDPMDISVARFFHRAAKWTQMGDIANAVRYPTDPDGYRKYCKDQDVSSFSAIEKNWYSKGGYWEEASKVPCRAEFVKVFEFYNMAERIHAAYNLQEMRVTLRDFAQDIGATAARTLGFLELPTANSPPENKLGLGEGQFASFYNDEERTAIAHLAKAMCIPAVWDGGFGRILQKYL